MQAVVENLNNTLFWKYLYVNHFQACLYWNSFDRLQNNYWHLLFFNIKSKLLPGPGRLFSNSEQQNMLTASFDISRSCFILSVHNLNALRRKNCICPSLEIFFMLWIKCQGTIPLPPSFPIFSQGELIMTWLRGTLSGLMRNIANENFVFRK